ncbi:hypothetical protein NOVOSPHI9U_560019 [Novosphingobium sp. 9U]|nr:hypothetical protein NOVOSPHI9U_560019 [Novosphingobium sp. 9U]
MINWCPSLTYPDGQPVGGNRPVLKRFCGPILDTQTLRSAAEFPRSFLSFGSSSGQLAVQQRTGGSRDVLLPHASRSSPVSMTSVRRTRNARPAAPKQDHG